ncbi:ATP-binding protein [Nocardioides sp. zg-1228]|uniref:sensor histidine kinase n=1 Tax=Nocardioides sp. zg-1228 TaxID=2763008 RepID=UPI001643078C|nr:GAF domain-containing sensor histidine kinase [Nocardioides sp. zg-1228]MBC2933439.1 GAF domain-containing sensor histidine kinase [Nocardioides sp. zg-1228]QSF56414.1 GAF domain-containing sensor histidine kinase [Nocardioides sp. zg-1228]
MNDGRERDRAIAVYGVLHDPPRRELDSLVQLAAQVAGVPFAAVNLLGSEVQHQVATTGFAGADSPVEDSMCRLVVEGGTPIMVEDAGRDVRFARNPWTTGEVAHVRYYGSHPLTTPSGVTIGTLCVFDDRPHEVSEEAAHGLAQLAYRVVDVLELELASRRLAEADARLSTSNERLANFAGQVSHDLKNPLTSISLSLETLELDVEAPDQLDTLARARRGVDRMTALIANLLEFAQQGRAPGDDVVDLAAELSSALDDLTGRLPRECVSAGVLPLVRGDAAQLRAVLMNLLDNAVKFTEPGAVPEVEVDSVPVDGHHRVEVRDRGRGVPEDMRERVFAPLARLDKRVEGSGIGLATCRRIIEAHGGRLGVEARDGGGSVFWFELPRAGA